MRVGRLTTRLLLGAGAAAAVLLAGANAAHADLPGGGNPPPKRPVITGSPASPGTDSTPTWAFTDPQGLPDTCHLHFEGVDVIARAACTSPHTYDLSALGYGTYTFIVENADAWSSSTYVRLPASPTITAAPASPDNDTTPTWSFALPPGTTGECTLLQGATAIDGPSACTSPQTYTLAADGTYTFRVLATGDGLDSTAVSSTYTLDTTPPPSPTVTSGPGSPSQDDTPTWSFTTPVDTASSRCTVSLGGTPVIGPAACTSPASFDLTAQPDGIYTFSVVNLDAVGNASAPDTSTYTLLRPPPPATLTGAPTSPDNDATPTWTFTLPAGATGLCSLSLGGTTVAGPAACAASQTYPVATDGTYTFTVVAQRNGLDSTPVTSTYTYDTTPPPPAAIDPATSPSSDTTPTFTFSLSGDAVSALCSFARTGFTVSPQGPCTSPVTFDLTGQPDATYNLRVWAVDAAGNIGTVSIRPYVLDTTPPPAPVFTAQPTSPGTDETPTWGFTTSGGTVSRQCVLTLGATTVSSGVCASPVTFDLTAQPVGTYTLTVTATDVAGNTGAPATSTYTLQRPPPAPVITGSPTTPDNDTSPTWTYTSVAGTTTTCSLQQGSTVVAAPADCTGGTQTYLLGADGTYTFRVFATDLATGLTSPIVTSTYTLDATPPATPTITGSPGATGNDSTPTWSFTTPATTANLQCVLRRGTTVLQTLFCSGSFTPNLAGSPDATYTFSVVAIDALGNRSAAATSTYVLDRVAPAAPVLASGPSGPTNDPTPLWTFTFPSGTTAICSLTQGGLTVSPATPCNGGTATYDLSARNDGTYTFRVTAQDQAGNGSTALTVVINLDRVAPAVPVITRSPTATSTDDTPEWRFTTAAGTIITCTVLQGMTVVVGPLACGSPATFDLTAMPDGVYTFNVTAADAAGNTSAPASSSYTLDAGRPPPPPPSNPDPEPEPQPVPTPVPPAPPAPSPGGPTSDPGDGDTTPTTRPNPRPTPGPGGSTGDGSPGTTTTTTVAEDPAPIPERIVEAAGRVVTEASRRAAFPLLLLALVFLFLVIQNRIDRMDPKLAEAPVQGGDELSFGPPPSRRGKR